MVKFLTERATWQKVMHNLGFSFMIAFLVIVLLVVTSYVFRAYVYPPPVVIDPLDKESAFIYHRGMSLDVHMHLRVRKAITLYVNTAVTDKTGTMNIPETESATVTLNFPYAAEFDQTVGWTIPALPKGQYIRVTSVRSLVDPTNPVYLVLPFEIGD